MAKKKNKRNARAEEDLKKAGYYGKKEKQKETDHPDFL